MKMHKPRLPKDTITEVIKLDISRFLSGNTMSGNLMELVEEIKIAANEKNVDINDVRFEIGTYFCAESELDEGYTELDIEFFAVKSTPNPDYEKQMKIYNKRLEQYNESIKK